MNENTNLQEHILSTFDEYGKTHSVEKVITVTEFLVSSGVLSPDYKLTINFSKPQTEKG